VRRLLPMCATAVAALALGIAGCGGSDDAGGSGGSGDGGDGAKSSEPIKIGAAVASTGFVSAFDIPAVNGAEIAIADINAKGGVLGRKLELVKGDTKSDVALGTRVANELIGKKAEMLLVSCDFDYGAPQALAAQAKGLIAISVCSASAKWGDLVSVGDLAFTSGSSVNGQGAAAAEWTYNDKRWRKAWMLTDTELVYNTGMANGFEDRWKQLEGTKIVGKETFKAQQDASIAAQISRLKRLSDQPDFIYVTSCPPAGAKAFRQIRTAGVDLPIVTSDCFDGTYWTDAVPNLSNFFYLTYGSIFGDDSNQAVNQFVEKYKEKAGEAPPTSHAFPGYTAIEAWAKGVEEAGTTESKAVKAKMETFKDEKFLVGDTTWTNKSHIASRPHAVMEVEDGKFKFLKTVRAEVVPPYRP
jgi:branched-chain amino acid transport system substrate-binding protein